MYNYDKNLALWDISNICNYGIKETSNVLKSKGYGCSGNSNDGSGATFGLTHPALSYSDIGVVALAKGNFILEVYYNSNIGLNAGSGWILSTNRFVNCSNQTTLQDSGLKTFDTSKWYWIVANITFSGNVVVWVKPYDKSTSAIKNINFTIGNQYYNGGSDSNMGMRLQTFYLNGRVYSDVLIASVAKFALHNGRLMDQQIIDALDGNLNLSTLTFNYLPTNSTFYDLNGGSNPGTPFDVDSISTDFEGWVNSNIYYNSSGWEPT